MHKTDEDLGVLLSWINTFDLPRRITSTSDLTDGTILLTVLNFLASEYFLDPKHLTTQNKVDIFNDIKIGLNKFCTHGLSFCLDLTEGLMSKKLVGGGTSKDWVTLLELVLLTSIKSTQKNLCIQRMMHKLNRLQQERLMNIISQSLVKFGLENQHGTPFGKCNKRARLNPEREDSCSSDKRMTSNEKKYLQQFEMLEKQMVALNSELESAASKYILLEKRRVQMKDQVDALQEEFIAQKKKHSLELSEKEQTIKKLSAIEREQEAQLDSKEQDIKIWEGKITSLQKEACDLEEYALKLKKINEDLMVLKTQKHTAATKLLKMEQDLRQKVKILEASESQNKLKLVSLKREIDSLKKYKDMYEKELTRSAQLEQEVSEVPSLKQQLEKYKQNLIKSTFDDSKTKTLQVKVAENQVEKQSIEQKLNEAKNDVQKLEGIVQDVQKAEVGNKRKIATLEAELIQTVSQSEHKKILNELDRRKKLVEQLSEKLTTQLGLEMKHVKKIEEFEKKNKRMSELIEEFQKTSQKNSVQQKLDNKKKNAIINDLEKKQQSEIKKLKEQLMMEKLVHSREQRLMVSAVKSYTGGLVGDL